MKDGRDGLRWGLLMAPWVVFAAVVVAMFLFLPTSGDTTLPSYATVRADWHPSGTHLLAADGQVVQSMRTDFKIRRGNWVPLDDISAALQRAVIASEDHRFYQHHGVDWLATANAAWADLWSRQRRGASTITMQLVAMLDPRLGREHGGRTIGDKIDQMRAALQLETRWSKAQILDAYLNLANYRGELVGVDALSRVMFQRDASGLTLQQAVLAAVLLRGPNASPATLQHRACTLLHKLDHSGPGRCVTLEGLVPLWLTRMQAPAFGTPRWAPHLERLLLDRQATAPDGEVLSSVNQGLQQEAVRAVRSRLMALQDTGVTDAAVVVLDNRTGAILAYVGSSGSLSDAAHVDDARALRQAGSTLKPFLYGLALDEKRLTAASLLDDRPLDLEGGSGLYVPDNYDHRFSGWVSARTALASSLNVPAVRTLVMVGPDVLAQRLRALGLPLKHGGDYYGYSLALGSADVTLLSLTNAYRALARGGNYAPVNLQAKPGAKPQSGTQLFSPQAAWLIGNILSDPQARARTFGMDSALATPFWTAVKTGTSRDMRDNWCVGWSADYTVGVWVGNAEGESMRHVSGVTGAGPIWHDVFSWLYRKRGDTEPPMPTGITERQVRFAPGIEPTRPEYFLAGTAQDYFAPPPTGVDDDAKPRIAAPVNGTILALDPDIPIQNQRMQLRAVDTLARPVAHARWVLDGKPLTQSGTASWVPTPGRHVFELRDATGKVLARSEVEVRLPPLMQASATALESRR